MKQTERAFQQQVIDLALLYRWRVYHTWNAMHSTKGYPDLHLIKPPHSIFAELKSDKGKVTQEQQSWLDMLKDCGYEAYVWRPGDFDEIVSRLAVQS